MACSNCGYKEQLAVSKREAAFGLVSNTYKCRNCSSAFFLVEREIPVDIDILKEWALHSELYLLDQDEDLILASKDYLDMILEILNIENISDYKRNILMSALCVIVYDNRTEIDDTEKYKPDIKLRNKVIEELNKRFDKLKLADSWIMPYIKEVVYPQLDFSKRYTS